MLHNGSSILDTLAQTLYANIYELDVEARSIAAYSLSTMRLLEGMPFHEWIHQIVSQLPFIQIKPFVEQTQIRQLVLELEDKPFHIVAYQIQEGAESKCYQLVFCYADENKKRILITKQDITAHTKKSGERVIELEKDSARFRFIISHLCENFGEIHVSTGKTWMTTCNDCQRRNDFVRKRRTNYVGIRR